MTAEKGRLFSIGQFAALHGVNKKTLMWYDEIGLFCPAVVKENGYRYYTYFQSATLEAILLLRELDVPVVRIRSFLDDRSAQSLGSALGRAAGRGGPEACAFAGASPDHAGAGERNKGAAGARHR